MRRSGASSRCEGSALKSGHEVDNLVLCDKIHLREPKWRNWQTRYVQGVVRVPSCGFKSHLRHSSNSLPYWQVVLFNRACRRPRACAKGAEGWCNRSRGRGRATEASPSRERQAADGDKARGEAGKPETARRGIIHLFEALISFNATRSQKTRDFVSFLCQTSGLIYGHR